MLRLGWLMVAVVAVVLGSGCNCGPELVADGGPTGPRVDAGRADSGAPDAAAPDSGFDSGAPDAAAPDSGFDAGAPDAGPPDAGDFDGGPSDGGRLPLDAGLFEPGCLDGTREGFVDLQAFPFVAACAGAWTGDIANASALCQAGWSVCDGSEPALRQRTFTEATAFPGCFPFDAAQDGFTCRSSCVAAVAAGIDTAQNIDMGAVGAGCAYQFPSGGSCLAVGRIDASENSGTGCDYVATYAGAVCCKN
jgi:hypothetical protein